MPVEESVFESNHSIIEFIIENFAITPKDVKRINDGSANCYKIICDEQKFFLKEFQSKFDYDSLDREIRICKKVEQFGISTSQFIQTLKGKYILYEKGHRLHLQKYIDGKMAKRNAFKNSLLLESAEILGKINFCLREADFLPDGFSDNWFSEWTPEHSLMKHTNIMQDIQKSNLNIDLKKELLDACKIKIELLSKFDMKHLNFMKLGKVNSHGDYNNLQLICDENLSHVKAVIDFSSAACVPAVWEIIRSYSYGCKDCKKADFIDVFNLKKYVDRYLAFNELTLFDVSNMAGFYYYNLLRSAFGLNAKDKNTIEFAIWRTKMCRYLSESYRDIDDFLYQQYKGYLR